MQTISKMRSRRLVVMAGLILAWVLPAWATDNVWTNTVNGAYNWSDSGNWFDGAVPTTSGADVRFNAPGAASVTSTVNAAWSAAGAVDGLTFLPGAQTLANNGTLTLANGAGVTSFSIGTNGIYHQNGRNLMC